MSNLLSRSETPGRSPLTRDEVAATSPRPVSEGRLRRGTQPSSPRALYLLLDLDKFRRHVVLQFVGLGSDAHALGNSRKSETLSLVLRGIEYRDRLALSPQLNFFPPLLTVALGRIR